MNLYIPPVNDTMYFFSAPYPAGNDQEERTCWKAVLSKLNAKCRSFRRPPHPRGRRAGSTSSAISSEGGSVSDVNNPAATPDHTSLEDAEHN